MTDRFLGSSTRQNTGNGGASDREARILRDRQAAYQRAADRVANSTQTAPTRRQLVQVFNGGAMPSTVPAVYFTHPVLAYGTEAEGGVPTLDTDTATTVPVIFLWHPPTAGDYVTATAASGRWVADDYGYSGSSGGGGGGSGYYACGACSIPLSDLTISYVLGGTFNNGSGTLVYSGNPLAPAWTSAGPIGTFDAIDFSLVCNSGNLALELNGTICPLVETGTCSPLNLVYALAATGPCSGMAGGNGATFTITP